ncbi:POTRA domain-containing protein [Flavobacteriales bacterium]|nr:POTRA domain-containing protein [Flavobacteriales bacterium]
MNKLIAIFICLLTVNINICLSNNDISIETKEHQISKIIITGNKITKESIILRELSFKKGDLIDIAKLKKIEDESKVNLTNLNLFNFITISNTVNEKNIIILIEVIERWYIWPYPILEISERNFNVWWDEFKSSNYSDFSRFNYGLFLNIENFRGQNELLMLKFRKGFKEHYMLSYETPNMNKQKTLGINTHLEFFRRKKTFYQTINNELVYFEDDNSFTSKEMLLNIEFVYRKNLKTKHKINFDYHSTKVNTEIIFRNPNYLLSTNDKGSFGKLSYQLIHENRNSNIYPTNGNYFDIEISKNIAFKSPINHYEISFQLEKHRHFSNRFILGSSLKSRISNADELAYFANQTLGFEDYVRGYEFYVVDGKDFYLSKTALKLILIENKKINLQYIKRKQFNKAHFSIYATVFSDLGYTNIRHNYNQNSLENTLQWGRGFSIDYVTYYDKMLRIEFSINELGEKGVFLHFSNPFGETNKK